MHGSWTNHALALDLPPTTPVKEQVAEFARRWERFPVAPERRDDPPFAGNTWRARTSTCSGCCHCSG
ncbi:hypothetical protein GTS_04690 [Gandjariella thermophila]|uniref:Uncharacterized protein n=1 Tax=Gandjariella thermophila TaxID=1931992 RepID=A0A4D4J2V0_9PSEU|nr:hypothetical protein GTS_04690 [Gandjariella thermophila]